MEKKKIEVKDYIENISIYDMCYDSLEEFKEYLNEYKAKHPEYQRISIDYDPWGEENHLELFGHRMETDEEYDIRMIKEQMVKEQRKKIDEATEKRERTTLARLQKKYREQK